MTRQKKSLFPYLAIVISVVLAVALFATSVFAVGYYAKVDCINHIEESAVQAADMFSHAMRQAKSQLTVFADILAANASNPDALLQTYMENFCKTQAFSAVCIQRADGTTASYGQHPHDEHKNLPFREELKKLPYVSSPYFIGDGRSEGYIYQAVPIVRARTTVAILYGFMSLDVFPDLVSTTVYDGQCNLYIVDGTTGRFLMDEVRRYDENGSEKPLANLYTDPVGDRDEKSDSSIEDVKDDIRAGRSGYYMFKPHGVNDWYYTYYLPMNIDTVNWSLQLTINETTAFASYDQVSTLVMGLMICMIICSLVVIGALLIQTRRIKKQDSLNLHKAEYMNAVQGALISAHNNPAFVDQALKVIGEEMQAETVLLLTFSEKVINQAYYWPSKDKAQAMELLGLDIRSAFPVIYDGLASKNSVYLSERNIAENISDTARELFHAFDINRILLTPIMDNSEMLKGAVAMVNMPPEMNKPEMLECLTRDFFMAITNLENHNIIKQMGAIDYLTGLKNRNSYESEIFRLRSTDAECLGCMFIDVNGLHELNNTKGHKAGDVMLCAVADTLKRIYGTENAYRLGGDEFLVFGFNVKREDALRRKRRIENELSQKGYSVSVGFQLIDKDEDGFFDIEKAVAQAESIMYSDKKEFYKRNNMASPRN